MESRFEFAFERQYRPLLLAWGATPSTCHVTLTDDELRARFGLVRLATPLVNIAGLKLSGDYSAIKAIGVRYSFTDRGLTFGSTTKAGVCVKFLEPVKPSPALWKVRHPGLTLTVSDPELFAATLKERIA